MQWMSEKQWMLAPQTDDGKLLAGRLRSQIGMVEKSM